jgi:hypothetical protein
MAFAATPARENNAMDMVMFWGALLAISILIYVLLDGFDLGVGLLFGFARDEGERCSRPSPRSGMATRLGWW